MYAQLGEDDEVEEKDRIG